MGCGQIGLPPSELWALELREFFAIYEGWRKQQEYSERQEWERTRWQACAIISPWLKGNKSVTELLPLPWDEKAEDGDLGYDPNDMEAREERVKQLMRQLNGREISESVD